MKSKRYLVLVGMIAGLFMTTTAYSGDGLPIPDMGGTGGSTLGNRVCVPCTRLPVPSYMCIPDSMSRTFCGSESWSDGTNSNCISIYTITVNCLTGDHVRYTVDEWQGAGTYCDGKNELCHPII